MQPALDEFELRLEIIRACDRLGSQAAFARQCGVSETLVSLTIRGTQRPGSKLLRAFGYERVTRYVRTSSPRQESPITESSRNEGGIVP
jgi:DNA-binding transcriptional regulator YdaS (Cro superfamily)